MMTKARLKWLLIVIVASLFVLFCFLASWPAVIASKRLEKMRRTTKNMQSLREMIIACECFTGNLPPNGTTFGCDVGLWSSLRELAGLGSGFVIIDDYSPTGRFYYYNFIERCGHAVNLEGDVDFQKKLRDVDWILVSCGPDGVLHFDPDKSHVVYGFSSNAVSHPDFLTNSGDIYFTRHGRLDRYTQGGIEDFLWE